MYDELGVRYEAVTEDADPGSGCRCGTSTSADEPMGPRRSPCRWSSCCTATTMTRAFRARAADSRGCREAHDHAHLDRAAGSDVAGGDVRGHRRGGHDGAPRSPSDGNHPQIDPSRVYFTGLSAGAMNSFTHGLNNLRRAYPRGVAGHSAPFGPPPLLDAGEQGQGRWPVLLPMYAIAGNRDMLQPLPVNQTPRSFYNVIRAFALLNGITVPGQARSRGQRDVRAEARWTWLERARRPPRHGRNALEPPGRHDQTGRARLHMATGTSNRPPRTCGRFSPGSAGM